MNKDYEDSDYADIDYETATDEESVKIRKLEHKLAAVGKSQDKRLYFIVGIPLALVLAYALIPTLIPPLVIIVLVPGIIFGGLGSVIYQNVRQTRKVMIAHGLKCPQCGHLPHRINTGGVLGAKKCPKCRTQLDI